MLKRDKDNLFFNWCFGLWGLVLLSLIIHLFISFSDSPGFWTDSFIYLLQADYFSNWNTEHLPVLDQAMAYRSFPPLYPLYLSILGAGSDNIILASMATSILLLPACLFYINWQIKEGLDKVSALINAAIFLLLPSTLLYSTELWSENLYLFFVLSTLWCFSKSNNISVKWLYLSAFACGLALVTRSVGISLAIALLIAVYRQDKRRTIFTALVIFVPSLIWALVSNAINYDQTYFNHGFLERYKSFVNAYGGVWAGISTIIQFQLKTFWFGLQLQFNTIVNIGTAVLASLVTITACIALCRRIMVLSLDALYVVLYLGLIFIWNFSDQNVRFIYVIMPIVLFYTQVTTSSLFKQGNKNINFFINLSIPLLIIVTILPCLMFMTNRITTHPGEQVPYIINDRFWLTGLDTEKIYKHLIFKKRLIESAIELKEIVPEDECIYSIHQEFVMLYSKRKSIIPPLQKVNQEEFVKELTQCRYMFIVASAHRKQTPLYPVDRVKNISWILRQSFYPSEYDNEIISVLLEIDK
jgi:Gpi18-like mannosyltransferase